MIEKLGERITIQKNAVEMDAYGNHKSVWQDYFSCHAYANTYQEEEMTSEVTSEQRAVIFEVRYCSELSGVTSDHYRILFRGEPYNILSVDMMNFDRKTIKLKARRSIR